MGEEIRQKEIEGQKDKSAQVAPLHFKRGVLLLQSGQHVAARGDFEQCIYHLAISNVCLLSLHPLLLD